MNNQIDQRKVAIGNTTSKSVPFEQIYVAGARVIILLAIIALFVLTQLYLAISLLEPVSQSFNLANSGSATFALATSFSLAYAIGFLIWDRYRINMVVVL